MAEHTLLKQEAGERIADDIRRAILSGELKPGNKLQGETELARLYKGSVYHVRKALFLLKKDRLIHSVPKVGVFVSGNPVKAPENAPLRKELPDRVGEVPENTVRFLTAENPFLSDCWDYVKESFCERFPFASAAIDFGVTPDVMTPPDIWECPSPFHKYQYDEIDAFDFSGFQDDSIALLSPKVVQFLNGADFLFCNPELLDRLGLPLPSWRTFDEQMEYLHAAVSEAANRPGIEIPGTIQQPVMRLNHTFYRIFADIRRSHFLRPEQFIEKYEPVFEKVTAFWRKFSISHPKQAQKNLTNFVEGKTPFFFGDSLYYGRAKPRTDFLTYPMLDVENRPATHASGLLLSARTACPVESVRFLRHLQSPSVQRCFAQKGLLPLRKEDFDALPFSSGRELLENTQNVSFFFHSREEQYIGMNIVNVELWDCILFEKSIQEALRNVLNLSKLYLKMELDKAVRARHENQAEIYS